MRISFSVNRNRKLTLLRDGRRREGAERHDELTRRDRMAGAIRVGRVTQRRAVPREPAT
jgi:hypothetical protein